MMKRLWHAYWLVVLILSGCNMTGNNPSVYTFTFDFNNGIDGWRGDFSDYPEGDSVFYELEYAYGPLPENISKTRKGILISGNNRSDDLFMFITRKLQGFMPNATYEVLINVRMASNAPTEAFGIGGAPGESVIVKVGMPTVEPKKVLVNGFYEMNIDKGIQNESGKDMVTIGHIGVAPTTSQYTEITRNNSSANALILKTNSSGEAWVIIGTDSGYEGKTTLYYTGLDLIFNEIR
jgi:hypothetical protein